LYINGNRSGRLFFRAISADDNKPEKLTLPLQSSAGTGM